MRTAAWPLALMAAGVICAASASPSVAAASAPDIGAQKNAPDTDLSKKGGSLSDKLGKTNGVVRPQGAVDPAIEKAPGGEGTMRVIPPPDAGSGAQPK